MSDWDDNSSANNDGAGGGSNNSGGGGLRKQLEETLARLKTLEDENSALKTQTRQAKISGLLTEKKLPAKVAKLIPADLEPTTEAVDKWLDEYGDVFNIQKDETDSGSNGTDDGSDGDSTDAEMAYIQTMRQMGSVTGGALPPEKAKDLLGKLNNPELTHQQLIDMINAHGGGVGMG